MAWAVEARGAVCENFREEGRASELRGGRKKQKQKTALPPLGAMGHCRWISLGNRGYAPSEGSAALEKIKIGKDL